MKEKLKDPNFVEWMEDYGYHYSVDSKDTLIWKEEGVPLQGKKLYKLYDQWFAEHQRRLKKELQIAKIVTWAGIGLMVIGVLLFIYTLTIKE